LSSPPGATEPSTLSLHAALPISLPQPIHGQDALGDVAGRPPHRHRPAVFVPDEGIAVFEDAGLTAFGKDIHKALVPAGIEQPAQDRKSTRLNSSHVKNSYAVFCL